MFGIAGRGRLLGGGRFVVFIGRVEGQYPYGHGGHFCPNEFVSFPISHYFMVRR